MHRPNTDQSKQKAPLFLDPRVAKVISSLPPGVVRTGVRVSGKLKRWFDERNPLAPPPQMTLFKMAMNFTSVTSLTLAARVGLADQLANGPKGSAAIARDLGLNEEATYRLLNSLAAMGVFEERPGRVFAQTTLSDVMRSDHPYTVRYGIAHLGLDSYLRAMSAAEHTLRTGEPGFDKANGMGIFDYMGKNPEESELFNKAQTEFTRLAMPVYQNVYDFSGVRTLVDIGGGQGFFLGSMIQKYPGVSGLLYDTPAATLNAPSTLASLGVADRVRVETGNFFEKVPTGADCYMMKNILHDWDDDKCVKILENVKAAMAPGAKIIVWDLVIEDDPNAQMLKQVNNFYFALFGGKERTEAEFASIFSRAGLRLVKVYQTGFISAVEGCAL